MPGGGDDQAFTATTAADGSYAIPGLPVGNYTAATSGVPAGTTQTQGVPTFTLVANTNRDDIDFGYTGTGTVGDRVYLDTDSDGVQDANGLEPGIPGLTVTLVWFGQDGNEATPADNLTLVATTGANGAFTFSNLPAGDFRIGVDTAGTNLTPTDAVDDGTLNPTGSVVVSLAAGQTRTDADFGLIGNASVGQRVWIDRNRDGVEDATEPGLTGAVVELVAGGADGTAGTADDMTFTVTTTAAPTGPNYLFGGLPVFGASDEYRATVTGVPAGLSGVVMTFNQNAGAIPPANQTTNPGAGTAVNFPVDAAGPNQNRRGVNWGFGGLSGLSGRVYRDDNDDGTQGVGEPGLGGVVVTLTGTDAGGNAVLDPSTGLPYSATTDATGQFFFTGLVPGTYTLTAAQPPAYTDGRDTPGSLGGDAAVNDVISGITLAAGGLGTGYLFGERGGPVSGTVFRDTDRDGTRDATEPGVAGVVVVLTGGPDNVTRTAVTDQTGNYRFDNLPAGTYTITETRPVGYADTPNNTAGFAPNVRTISVPPAGLVNQNFGEVLGSLSGTVYLDVNNNGSRQAGEPGLSGVTVALTGTDAAGAAVRRTAITDGSGGYVFDDLLAGNYSVTEFQPTLDPDGLDGQDNPAGVAGSLGGTIGDDILSGVTLPAGGAGANYNFGERPPLARPGTTSLSGTVWIDTDQDGTIDPTEPALGGVTVVLTAPDGSTRTTTSGPDGAYLFTDLPPGTYTVTETPPTGYGSTTPTVRSVVIPPTLVPVTGVDFGSAPGSLSGRVFADLNGDGTRQAGEPGIAGVTVNLTGPVSRTAITDEFGDYRFTNLPAGSYTITETQPAAFDDGTDTAGSLGGTVGNDTISAITLPAGADGTGYTFGERLPAGPGAILTGTVWLDRNRDGVFDTNERGVNGVVVELLDANGTVVGTTTTGPDGGYRFTGVPSGTYTVRETQPTEYGSGTPNLIPVFVPPVLTPITGLNFGDTPAAVSGSIYLDRNNNGTRDPGEPGIGGATVTVTGTDINGNPVTATGTTDPTGYYQIDDLPASNAAGYTLTETQPAGYGDGSDAAGTLGGTAGNDVISAVVVPAGQAGRNYQFGERGANSIGGFVYLDYDLNGVFNLAEQDRPFGGGTVVLNNGTTTDQPALTLTTPQFVVVLSGVDARGNLVNRSTVTAADGSYSFPDLPAGTYSVYQSTPVTPVLVNGTDITGVYNGADSVGTINGVPSGSNPAANQLTVTLTGDGSPANPAQSAVGYNFGELPPADPFGFVFADENGNGVREAGEAGIAGVPVTISGTAFAGTPFARPLTAADIPGGSLTVLTDANGRWEFTPIPPGLYTIRKGSLPAGVLDGAEENADPNGQAGTPVVVANDEFSNLAVQPFPVRGPFNFGHLRPGRFSGSVYHDLNRNGVRDAGEPGLAGVVVTLTGTVANLGGVAPALRGTPVGPITVQTDAAGNFTFTGLLPGTYALAETQPATFGQGRNTAGTAGGTLGGTDLISGIVLAAGQQATDYRFGEVTRQLSPVPPIAPDPVSPPPLPPTVQQSKQQFLSSSAVPTTAPVPSATPRGTPNYAALGSVNTTRAYQFVATGDGPGGGRVRVFNLTDGAERFRFEPFPGFRGGIRTAVADVTGDGVPDILAAAGPGGGPAVAIYDGDTGALLNIFFAYEQQFTGGVFLAAGDVDGDGRADVVTGADLGGGPRVRAFSAGNPNAVLADFWGIDDPNFTGGVRVAVGDVNADGRADVVAAAGLGGGPRVSVYDGRSFGTGATPTNLFNDFFAFESTFRGGAYVTVGDVDGDGFGEVIAGAGEGGGPRVTSFSGRQLLNGSPAVVTDTFAFDLADNNGGARVAAVDLDGDGRTEVFVGSGPGVRSLVRFFDPRTGRPFDTFSPDAGTTNGAFVG